MKSSALKNSILENLSQIEDVSFLKAINTIIENKMDNSIYQLTPKQRTEIERSQHEISKGNFVTNDKVESQMKSWLKRK